MSQSVMQVNINVTPGGTLPVGTSLIFGGYAPTGALGGGITIVGVKYSSNEAIAAASAPVYTIVKTTSAGVVNGTISTVLGSAAFTAGTTRVGTLSTVFVDAEEQWHIRWAQTAANADKPIITAVVQYVMGR